MTKLELLTKYQILTAQTFAAESLLAILAGVKTEPRSVDVNALSVSWESPWGSKVECSSVDHYSRWSICEIKPSGVQPSPSTFYSTKDTNGVVEFATKRLGRRVTIIADSGGFDLRISGGDNGTLRCALLLSREEATHLSMTINSILERS